MPDWPAHISATRPWKQALARGHAQDPDSLGDCGFPATEDR